MEFTRNVFRSFCEVTHLRRLNQLPLFLNASLEA